MFRLISARVARAALDGSILWGNLIKSLIWWLFLMNLRANLERNAILANLS
jgi:hypothetical protein